MNRPREEPQHTTVRVGGLLRSVGLKHIEYWHRPKTECVFVWVPHQTGPRAFLGATYLPSSGKGCDAHVGDCWTTGCQCAEHALNCSSVLVDDPARMRDRSPRLERCRHDLPISGCFECSNREIVYISSGGFAYHAIASCAALREGQDLVLKRGGTPSMIEPTSLARALAGDRTPCHTCWPSPRRSA